MKNLQDVTERVCELKGSLVAIDALLPALLDAQPTAGRSALAAAFDGNAETARTVLLHAPVSDHVLNAFERQVSHLHKLLAEPVHAPPRNAGDPVLFTTTRIRTLGGGNPLTGASGFFFRRGERLFLITSRHVLFDEPSHHFPDRIEIDLHTHPSDLTCSTGYAIPLYSDGLSLWRQADDSAGTVDVAAIEIDMARLPGGTILHAFEPRHLAPDGAVEVGDALAIVGFPLGFHDTVHHLPVVRNASIASAYGVRFQGHGYFLTDARTHRGSSGAPVLRRSGVSNSGDPLPWQLLGIHSTRMDMGARDLAQDESLGLNCAWYADVLMALTA